MKTTKIAKLRKDFIAFLTQRTRKGWTSMKYLFSFRFNLRLFAYQTNILKNKKIKKKPYKTFVLKMVRITSELLSRTPIAINAMKERELTLRGIGIFILFIFKCISRFLFTRLLWTVTHNYKIAMLLHFSFHIKI